MLEIFDNLRKKLQLAKETRSPSWTTPFRMKDWYPSFLQIDLRFTLRASHVSSCQSLFLVFFSDKPLKKISLATNIQGNFSEIFFCCCLLLLFYYIVYFFITLPQDDAVWRLPCHKPTTCLDRLYSSRSTAERLYGTVCSYGLACMRDRELEKVWGGGRGRNNKNIYIHERKNLK